jgi:hypothetical protein
MSISRRIFMKLGTAAAIAAGLSLKPSIIAFGQEITNGFGAPVQSDPLSYYTQSTFLQYVNSVFRLRGFTTVDVTLMKVEDTLPKKVSRAGGRESFILYFRGGSVSLPQDTYAVEHAALGNFSLFLVPTGPDENGAQGYVATINRLAYAAKPGAVPRKPTATGSERPEAKPVGPPSDSAEPKPKVRPEAAPVGPPSESAEPKPEVPVMKPRRKIGPETLGGNRFRD